jgi:hypothetical protein
MLTDTTFAHNTVSLEDEVDFIIDVVEARLHEEIIRLQAHKLKILYNTTILSLFIV